MSWSDSGARTGPHEIGLIAKIAATSDDDAARRLYRKYHMELFRFGVHVLHDQGLAEDMVQETFIKFCRKAPNYDASRGPVRGWLFTMAKSVAYDIARRPSSRPFLPVEDFQLPPQYDTVDDALTTLTVDQALDKLPLIYADVMRLVRDGLTHAEIAEPPRHPDRHRQIPDGQGGRHAAGRAGQPAKWRRRCSLNGTSSRPIPRPSTSLSATCPQPGVPNSTAISPAAPATARPSWTSTAEIGQVIKQLPPHVEPPPDLEDRTVAAMVAALAKQRATGRRPDAEDEAATRAYPIPGRQPFQEPETRVQPIPQFQPPAENETALRQSPSDPPAPAGPQGRPTVTRLPVWRRSRGRLAAIAAVAAAIITAAIVIPLSLLGSGTATVIPLYATAAAKVSGVGAATGQATARQDTSGSWQSP